MKKILAVFLTILMALSIATTAFAADVELDDAQTSVGAVTESDSTVGDDILDVYDDIKNEDYESAYTGFVGAIRKFYNAVHELVHGFVKKFKFPCPFCGKIIVEATPENINEVLAELKSGETLILLAGDYGAVTLGELDGIVIEGGEGIVVDKFVTTADTVLKDVTIKGFDFDIAAVNRDCGLHVDAAAVIENLVIEDSTFTGVNHKNSCGIFGNNPTATLAIRNCTFSDMGYALWSVSGGGYAALTLEDCTFTNLKSWVVLVQYNTFAGSVTITGCEFVACTGGVSKNGTFAEGASFTLTNNILSADCTGHDGKDSKWFELKTASAVIEGNTYGGEVWIPGADQGIKAL